MTQKGGDGMQHRYLEKIPILISEVETSKHTNDWNTVLSLNYS